LTRRDLEQEKGNPAIIYCQRAFAIDYEMIPSDEIVEK
jgi:hypothetical protein